MDYLIEKRPERQTRWITTLPGVGFTSEKGIREPTTKEFGQTGVRSASETLGLGTHLIECRTGSMTGKEMGNTREKRRGMTHAS